MPILSRGDKIGKYIVQNLIKENLYTETYRTEDEEKNPYFLKLFVLKRLPVKLLNSETNEVLEIEYCRNIKHKNIISFIDSGVIDSIESECQYYLTNYLSGELLSERIRRDGSIPEKEALKIYTSILEGLLYMHKQGLFHNNITSRNIMFPTTTNGTAEIIDLGHTSHRCCGKVSFDTNDLEILYSANESFAGMYDEQTDIFSATVLLYVMLIGESPWNIQFPENTKRSRKVTLLKKFRKENPIDFVSLPVSEKVKVILAKGLGLTAKERYNNINEVFSDINTDEIPEILQEDRTERKGSSSNSMPETSMDSLNKVDFEIKKGKGGGFAEIAGMNNLKEYLSQRVIFVIQNKEKAEKYKLSTPNGMLLYGPPGCGKTFIAEKFAEETKFNFILVKSSDLASSYVHGAQEKIAQLFKQAEKHSPIVICFDEFDAFVPDRSNPATQYTASEVNEFLTQLNNCSKKGIFVIGTTNRPDKIDPAVLRTGRIDKLVYVPMPDEEARKGMFLIHLFGRPYNADELDLQKLAELTDGFIASDIAYVVNEAAMVAAYTDKEISQILLEETIKNTRPSLRKDTLKIYEDIRNKMDNKDRANITRPKVGFIS